MPETPMQIEPERLDELPLAVGLLAHMQIAKVIDAQLGSGHGNRQGLSYGQLAQGFSARIMTLQDHRLSPVEAWSQEHQAVLSQLLGAPVRAKDFTDDRRADALYALGSASAETRDAIEMELGQHLVRAYRLPTEVGRADTTSVSVYHEREEEAEGLLQFGKSKDHRPDLRQYVQALGTLDPAGIPLVSETLDGNTGDPPVYLPVWRRMVKVIGHTDWLFVGDSKWHSAQNIAEIHRAGGFLLTPLQMTGHMPDHFAAWLEQRPKHLTSVTLPDAKGSQRRVGRGYEVAHTITWEDPQTREVVTVPLRVFMVQRDQFKAKQIHELENRLTRAEAALNKLNGRCCDTPAQCTDLETQAQALLAESDVADYLSVRVRWQEQQFEQLVGGGRPGPNRRTRVISYQLAHVSTRRQPAPIAAYEATAGWRAYATNAPRSRLTLQQAVEKYAGQWQPERGFGRLKGDWLNVAPIFLRTDDHIRGLMVILSFVLRAFTLIEFVVRRALQAHHDTLPGLYEGAPRKTTARPSTERLLKAFEGITLLRIRSGRKVQYQLSGFSKLHRRILNLLDLPVSLYTGLESSA
ncbi:MAG TPA: IS1634 family transposase [Anaerolineae bacterium]|nr:IS1634 family transposase [Anaerolineae bacterium]